MADFSKFLLATDLDGTLVDHHLQVNPLDLKALERFTQGGGLFTLATGRATPSTYRIAEMVPINAPAVLCNGGCIYDFQQDRPIHEVFLPDNARLVLEQICARFPKLRAAVIKDKYYDVTYVDDGSQPFVLDKVSIYPAELHSLEYPWYKVLCNICGHDMNEVLAFAQTVEMPGMEYVTSTDFYFELVPAKVNKAEGIIKMMELAGISGRTLVCVGDYYNDLQMIQSADIGAAIGGAPAQVREAANIVLGPQNEAPIAQLIKHLEEIG